MNCPSVEILQALVLTDVSDDAEESKALEQHLSLCTRCQETLSRLESVSQPLDLLQMRRSKHRDAEEDELIGENVASYTILERASRAKESRVYKAVQVTTQQIVALKILPKHRFASETLGHWAREAGLAGRINHPNVVRIFDAGQDRGYFYCAFEWLDGGDLGQRLRQSQFEVRVAAEYARDLAAGCMALHSKKVLHRDLKPSNVLLSGNGIIKVADFGIARSLDDTIMTSDRLMVGTPGYMSPEQLGMIAEKLTPATDVYGIGAVLYEMLSGRCPFSGSNPVEVIGNATNGDIVPPSAFRRIPRDLETICLKCLERLPAQRYPSAEAVRDDLDRFIHGEPIVARSPTLLKRIQRKLRRNPQTSLALGGLLACVLFFIAGIVWAAESQKTAFARLQLERLLKVTSSEVPQALIDFLESSSRHRRWAIKHLNDVERRPVKDQLRIALARQTEPRQLLAETIPKLSELQTVELWHLVDYLRRNPHNRHWDFDESAILEAQSGESRTELKLLALKANWVSPERLANAELVRIAQFINRSGDSDEPIWLRSFQPISDRLFPVIISMLDNDQQLRRDVLLSYAFEWTLNQDHPSAAHLSKIIQLSSPESAVAISHRLEDRLRKLVAKELFNVFTEFPNANTDHLKNSNLPESLKTLRSFITDYSGWYCDQVLLLPLVPMDRWPELKQIADSAGLEVICFRPCRVGTKELVAITFIAGETRPTTVSIDVPESDIERMVGEKWSQGQAPLSVWGRPATNGDLNHLLVSVVWQEVTHPSQILFDKTLEQLGFLISPGLHGDANSHRFWTQQIGTSEDIEATTQYASGYDLKREDVLPKNKFIRSITLVRTTAPNQPIDIKNSTRVQRTESENLPQNATIILQRNFAFQDRIRKLSVAVCSPEQHLENSRYLSCIGFSPESVSLSVDEQGHPVVASRWSAPFLPADQKIYPKVAVVALTAFLLGDDRAILQSFDSVWDRTTASWLIHYGEYLDSRHSPLVLELLTRAKTPQARYSVAMLSRSMPESAISKSLREALVRERAQSRNAAFLSATSFLDAPRAELASSNGELLGSDWQKVAAAEHGTQITASPGGTMVVIDVRKQPQLVGGTTLFLWDSEAAAGLQTLHHSFAIGQHEVTYREYSEYMRDV